MRRLQLVAAAGFCFAVAGSASGQSGVSARGCGIAAGGSISGSRIEQHCYIYNQDPNALAEAARIFAGQIAVTAEAKAQADVRVVELARQLGASTEAVEQFFRLLGEQHVELERLPRKLAEIAAQHRETLARLSALDPQDPAVQALRGRAQEELRLGRFAEADRLLAEAEQAEIAAAERARQMAQQAEATAEQRLVRAAADRGARGGISLTQLDYLGAAAHFRDAAALVPASRPDEKSKWLDRQASALLSHGVEHGDGAQRQSIEVWRAALAEAKRASNPLRWVLIANNFGTAFRVLGARHASETVLGRAVAAYEAALDALSPIRRAVPLRAVVQTNLGHALKNLGELKGDEAVLRRAVSACGAALEELVRERASTALGEFARERAPLDWADAQACLGDALATLGGRTGDADALRRAVAAYEAALEERTRERAPSEWATTQINLGDALRILGERGDEAALRRAFEIQEAVLEQTDRERAPTQWAVAQNNLGEALKALGARGDEAALGRAIGAFESALGELRKRNYPAYAAATERNLAAARALLRKPEPRPE